MTFFNLHLFMIIYSKYYEGANNKLNHNNPKASILSIFTKRVSSNFRNTSSKNKNSNPFFRWMLEDKKEF